MAFLNAEQQALAQEIATLLSEREQKVAVAEATAGGLISAALLWVPGASRYFAGGGVTYTLNSRIALAGVPVATLENYRGTTPEMIVTLAESMRERLGADWCIAESGWLAGHGARAFRARDDRRRRARQPFDVSNGAAERESNMIGFIHPQPAFSARCDRQSRCLTETEA
jgi:hypothetical protein